MIFLMIQRTFIYLLLEEYVQHVQFNAVDSYRYAFSFHFKRHLTSKEILLSKR